MTQRVKLAEEQNDRLREELGQVGWAGAEILKFARRIRKVGG